jgi:predicted SprT family Zn-dependent metalloprotease
MTDSAGTSPSTPDELCAAAAEYAATVDIDVPLERVTWNVSRRAKTYAGRCNVTVMGEERTLVNPVSIDLTWEYFETYGWAEMQRVIRHELIHLHEFDQYGESDHGERFQRLADGLDADVHCKQFSPQRYHAECAHCGERFAASHNRTKFIKAPEIAVFEDCSCDGLGFIRVVDVERDVTWTTWREFAALYADAAQLKRPYRFMLWCPDCEHVVGTREAIDGPVREPERYGCSVCDRDGHVVIDHETGNSWVSSEEYALHGPPEEIYLV